MANTLQACTCSSQYGRRCKDYWKLPCPKHSKGKHAKARMNELGFKFPSAAKKNRLIYLSHRAERGLLSYDKCSKAELQKFVIDRRLTDDIDTSSPKTLLVEQLEHADDHLDFNSFVELPPEIRCLIYEYHIKTFGTVEAQPLPITQVCQLVRQEALPLLYQHSRLVIRIISGWRYAAHESTDSLFKWADADHIARIRTLRLVLYQTWMFQSHVTQCQNVWHIWDLNLDEETLDQAVVEVKFEGHRRSQYTAAREERLRDFILNARGQKLQRKSLQDIALACDVVHN